MEKEKKITIAQLDAVLSPASDVTYWQRGMPVPRRDIFDDCEVFAIELDNQVINGRARSRIAVYVGERISE